VLKCVDAEGSPCSVTYLQSLLLGYTPFEQVQASKKQLKHYFAFGLPCRALIFLGSDGNFRVADGCFSCGSYKKHHVLSPVKILLRNARIFVSTIDRLVK
jgi:hypothetical protein